MNISCTMEKLDSFHGSSPFKLFRLAKELNRSRFFLTFLTSLQYRILSFILAKDDIRLWTQFIDGNCTLSIDKSAHSLSDGENAGVDALDNDSDAEEPLDGNESLRALALHVRYLLWEKAIDYLYLCKDLDLSVNDIHEVSDDYALIDKIGGEANASNDQSADRPKEAEVKVRREEDDYDDDDEDDIEGSEDLQSSSSDEPLPRNDDNEVILTIPLSELKEPAAPTLEATLRDGIANGSTKIDAAGATEAISSSATRDPTANAHMVTTDQSLIKEFNKVYHNFEYDKDTLIKRRKLEESDKQLEESSAEVSAPVSMGPNNPNVTSQTSAEQQPQLGINLGSALHSLKHLLKTIQHQREHIDLNDFELRSLFMDVRKNRGKWASDERLGQEELYEACEKVVMELRGYTEHSTPFLNKVSKREAPNYGLIIKKPMDLNTVMKRIKNLHYNSKAQFVDDLNLIWNNCLTYNVDPKHFLRAHAIAMQKQTNKLVPTIPDITIKSRAEVEREEELEDKNDAAESRTSLSEPSHELGSGKSSKKGRKRTRTDEESRPAESNGESVDVESNDTEKTEDKEVVAEPDEDVVIKLEDQVDTNGAASDMKSETLEKSNSDLNDTDEVAATADDDEDDEAEADGEPTVGEPEEEDNDPELQAWRSMTAKSRATYCAKRSDLFKESYRLNPDAEAMIRESEEMNNFKLYLSNEEVVSKNSNLLESDEPYLLEYDVMGGLPGMTYAGTDDVQEMKRERKLVDLYLQQLGGDIDNVKSRFVLPTTTGLNKVYHEIIGKIQDIRKICFKISLIRQMQTQQFVHHTQMKQPEVDDIKEVDVDPMSRLSNHEPFSPEVQYSVLRKAVSKVAMQTGFELTEPFAINALTQVTENYFANLVRTMKMHLETTSSNKLSYKEALLTTLLENGVNKPDDLYTFVQERIIKQSDKLKDLKVKLSNFLKELLRPGLENFNEKSFEDNSEQFMTGDFSSDLGDDFFGFKELGLDKEFKMLSGAIPIYLLHSRLHNNYTSTGIISKKNKYVDLMELKDPKLLASAISKQIGVLQPFYQKLLEKTKTHYIKTQKKKGELTELPNPDHLFLIEDEELPQKQRNIRPRLPPTGKIVSVKKRMLANGFFLPDDTE